MRKKEFLYLSAVILVAVLSAVVSSVITNTLMRPNAYEEFYTVETQVSVSPSDYVDKINSGSNDSILVDLRSSGEYATQHLKNAINIPAIEMSRSEVVAAFRMLPKNKEIITYCYSSYCTLSRQVGKTLADNGIYVKHMTAGWLELKRDYSQYITNETTASGIPENLLGGGTCSASALSNGSDFSC